MGCSVAGCTRRKKGHSKHNGPNGDVVVHRDGTAPDNLGFVGRPALDIETGEQPIGPDGKKLVKMARNVGDNMEKPEPKIVYTSRTGRPPFHSADLLQEFIE